MSMSIVFEKPRALTDAPLHYCPGHRKSNPRDYRKERAWHTELPNDVILEPFRGVPIVCNPLQVFEEQIEHLADSQIQGSDA